MSSPRTVFFAIILLFLPGSVAHAADATTQPCTVFGRITVENNKPIPEMIVYLEATNPSIKFDAPKTPAIISQKGAQFSPSFLAICVGQTVEFPNDEARPIEHNVFSQSPAKAFDLGLYSPPARKSLTFDKPGPVRLFCSVRRYMDGVIFVSATPFLAQVSSDGIYKISNIPPGEYKVKTFQRNQRYPERESTVTLTGGQSTPVIFEMSRR